MAGKMDQDTSRVIVFAGYLFLSWFPIILFILDFV